MSTQARKQKSAAVRHSFLAVRTRRAAIAASFRAALLRELGAAATSASKRALVATAVSAYVEVAEISALFLENRASPRARQSMGVARGQLQRALVALGIVKRDASDPPLVNAKEIVSRIVSQIDDARAAAR